MHLHRNRTGVWSGRLLDQRSPRPNLTAVWELHEAALINFPLFMEVQTSAPSAASPPLLPLPPWPARGRRTAARKQSLAKSTQAPTPRFSSQQDTTSSTPLATPAGQRRKMQYLKVRRSLTSQQYLPSFATATTRTRRSTTRTSAIEPSELIDEAHTRFAPFPCPPPWMKAGEAHQHP